MNFRCTGLALVLLSATQLWGCGDDAGDHPIGGTVSGLGDKGSLTLTLNGDEQIALDADGTFSFPTLLQANLVFSIAITAQPLRAVCDISDGSGVANTLSVNTATVRCLGSDASLQALESSTTSTFEEDFDAAVLEYRLNLSLLVQELTLTATTSDPDATITIEDAVAVSGAASSPLALDFGTTPLLVVVRAPAGNSTSYRVSVKRGDALALQEAYGKASNSDAGDQFGVVMAMHGDTLVVGAPQEESNATGVNGDQADGSFQQAGAVYVFRRVNHSWAQEAYLKASNTAAFDRFGASVAILGDTIAVGALQESSSTTGVNGDELNNDANNSGAVYVFRRTASVWAQEAYVKASNTGSTDSFGTSVTLGDDTLVVGALLESSDGVGVGPALNNNDAGGSGAVYIFRRSDTSWTQEAFLKASNTGGGDHFGSAVSLSGDILAVGAHNEDSSARGVGGLQNNDDEAISGAAYVFLRTGNTWIQEAYIKSSNTDTGDGFGNSLALDGNILAIGAAGEDSDGQGVNGSQGNNDANNSGAVYVFLRNGGAWSQEVYLKASNANLGGGFGTSVALLGDTLAVGAIGDRSNATGVGGDENNTGAAVSGAAFVFWRTGVSWVQNSYVKSSNTQVGDQFGSSVALSGDALSVGARFESSNANGIDGAEDDDKANSAGAIYILQ